MLLIYLEKFWFGDIGSFLGLFCPKMKDSCNCKFSLRIIFRFSTTKEGNRYMKAKWLVFLNWILLLRNWTIMGRILTLKWRILLSSNLPYRLKFSTVKMGSRYMKSIVTNFAQKIAHPYNSQSAFRNLLKVSTVKRTRGYIVSFSEKTLVWVNGLLWTQYSLSVLRMLFS